MFFVIVHKTNIEYKMAILIILDMFFKKISEIFKYIVAKFPYLKVLLYL